VTAATALDPNGTALLVMDYQPAMLAGYSDASTLIERTGKAVARSRAAGIRIIKDEATALLRGERDPCWNASRWSTSIKSSRDDRP
jgi:hypothetical protein